MRTCGNCGWPDKRMGTMVHCSAWALTDEHYCGRSACALWKPKQDWREETCGTCEFFDETDQKVEGCHRRGYREVGHHTGACAEWMPREGVEDV